MRYYCFVYTLFRFSSVGIEQLQSMPWNVVYILCAETITTVVSMKSDLTSTQIVSPSFAWRHKQPICFSWPQWAGSPNSYPTGKDESIVWSTFIF